MTWPISNHESPDVDLSIPVVTAPHYLWAMLKTDGDAFRANNYAKVRLYLERAVAGFSARTTGGQAPNVSVSEQRLRTWKAAFEEMGLLTVDEGGLVQATRFGRAITEGLESVEDSLARANRRIAHLGAQVANRVLLAKPDGRGQPASEVPADADLLPLRAIWRAFRRLGNRLHWQDINRVLGHVHFERDVEAALDRIATFRKVHAGVYPTAPTALAALGPDTLTEDPRHITPWFNRAGIGGMLIPSEPDAAGFRTLPDSSVSILDGLLSDAPPHVPREARTSREAYITYLMAPVDRESRPQLPPGDVEVSKQVLAAMQDFGDRRFIVLSGIPGTGKSRLARLVADHLTDGDPLRLKDIQFHESTSYEDFIEGFVPRADGQGFERRSKTFRVINQRALDDPDHVYVLLIEEFTRANVHSVLGELLTFVEHRGRRFTLPLSQEECSIAKNLVILATMNPRDRSAISLDDAVVRRMHRIEICSSVHSLHSMLQNSVAPSDLAVLTTWFAAHLDVLPFGHGVFHGATTPTTLRSIWRGTALPLLADPLGRTTDVYKEAVESFPFAAAGEVTEVVHAPGAE